MLPPALAEAQAQGEVSEKQACNRNDTMLMVPSSRRSHVLSAEATLGNIFCSSCNDFVYDPELDQVAEACQRKSARSVGMVGATASVAWRPSQEEVRRCF